jgi:hypothetical protein
VVEQKPLGTTRKNLTVGKNLVVERCTNSWAAHQLPAAVVEAGCNSVIAALGCFAHFVVGYTRRGGGGGFVCDNAR